MAADYSAKQKAHLRTLMSKTSDLLAICDQVITLLDDEQKAGYGDSNTARFISNTLLAGDPEFAHITAADLSNVYGSIDALKTLLATHRVNFDAILPR